MFVAVLIAAATLSTALAQSPGAQRYAQTRTTPARADSQRVLRGARSAQAAFERTRRANLPLDTRGTSGRCDVRVGRFCYWWDDGEFTPPPEPSRTAKARDGLLDRLGAAADVLPGDEWIAGQRVRYLVEAGRAADAVDAARECRAAERWCAALAGFALHAASDFAAADSAFAVALAAMSPDERCRWTDIHMLLDGAARKQYERLGCDERAALEARYWALSRPLFLMPANDLRTEHFARLTMAQLIRSSRYAHDMSWGDDSQEMLVRYGWETSWAREPASISYPSDVHVVGLEPTPSFSFAPQTDVLVTPGTADAADWSLHDANARSRYAPRYARSIRELDPQVAFFRRGDSALVVAAYDLSDDTAFARDSLTAALAAAPARSPDSVAIERRRAAPRRAALRVPAPWDPLIVSVEARDSAARRIARARTVARPPTDHGRITLSDLLLFDDPDSLPRSLDDATARARGSLAVGRDARVGVYWEMYGVDPRGETLAYTMTVTREGTPWYRRAAERLRLVDHRAPVRMQWDEPSARPGATRSRALALDLSTLPPGRYRLELALEAGGAPAATATREIAIR